MGERLTIKETAKRIGIARGTLYGWIHERGFPVHRINEHIHRCDWDEAKQWIDQQAPIAAPPEPGRLLRIARHTGERKPYPRTR